MAGRPRKSQQIEDNAIINQENLNDLSEETKDRFLKRISKEEKEHKKIYSKEDRYIEIIGKKVLEKFKNKTGSVYTRYWFNAKRYPLEVKIIKEKGGYIFEEKGDEIFVPLKYVDGRPFIKKG